MQEENLVKKVCKELSITYKGLGEKIGVKESTLKAAASTNKISLPLQKAIELYVETVELKAQLAQTEKFKSHLKEFVK